MWWEVNNLFYESKENSNNKTINHACKHKKKAENKIAYVSHLIALAVKLFMYFIKAMVKLSTTMEPVCYSGGVYDWTSPSMQGMWLG